MKRQIRRGVFETNSSSVHSITICSKSDYDRWMNGELVWDRWKRELVPITDEIKESIEEGELCEYYTYEQFNDWEYIEFETYESEYTTENGEEIVAFGYYGFDR